ncbi:hypothetical protein PV10_02352 [Exophiala mesophila]|uniref:BRCT domain-containing protein n=1 Tax=Exophiala mesophila TaxID=212818 RepID=A0A0D1WYQ9_EXOME|nr:uncharacterized protein PV10_02352 [Exophiala mesophila]KIV94600.1 hypothetical protein PV10_02352 [Exophiala mesophila]
MAPRKAASPAKPRRVTRAQAAAPEPTTTIAEPPKRRTTSKPSIPTTSATKNTEAKSRITKRSTSSTATTKQPARPAARSTRAKAVPSAEEPVSEAETDQDELAVVEPLAPSTTRTTSRSSRTQPAATTSTLAAVPRRRVRVTPMDGRGSNTIEVAEPETKKVNTASSRVKDKPASTKTTASSRSKRTTKKDALDSVPEQEATITVSESLPKKRGRPRANTAEKDMESVQSIPALKSRGRPKKENPIDDPTEVDAPAPSTRQTRARATSTASAASAVPTMLVAPPRKKVTFQDLPDDEDEKENIKPPLKSTKKAFGPASKKSEPAAKGIKARPVRKPATTAAAKSARGRAAAKAAVESEEPANDTGEKIQQRALTPKKITQVAKASISDSEEDEDELAGAKTPVRDLSRSPKRNVISSAAKPMSPVRKLDFGPSLSARSPSPDAIANPEVPGLLSPARRNPTSPTKEVYDQSPRRAPDGVSIFRQVQDFNQPASSLFPSTKNQVLLQSPKRGLTDVSIFPPSAIKLSKSPSRAPLLSSPARRLFSPSKQKTPARISPSPKKKHYTTASPASAVKSPGDLDIEVTSHFRPSMSPHRSGRVYTLNEDELVQEAALLDFDQSVLNVRSPLKVDKVKPVVESPVQRQSTLPTPQDVVDDSEEEEQAEELVIEPMEIAVAPQPIDPDETLADPDVEDDDVSEHEESDAPSDSSSIQGSENDESIIHHKVPHPAPRLSNVLFSRLRDVDQDSEDELLAEQTPDLRNIRNTFRSSLNQSTSRSRLSSGIAPPSAARNMGFTPLTNQMRGWKASSPQNRVKASEIAAQSHGLFSPLARVHVEGSVEIDRQETPGRSAKKRKSHASRVSFGPSVVGSPANPDFFADGIAAQEFYDDNQSREDGEGFNHEDLHDLVSDAGEEQPQSLAHRACEFSASPELEDDESESEHGEDAPGELTTDLIKFTKASDTAMVDFATLADEAEQLAQANVERDVPESAITDNGAESTESGRSGLELSTVDEEPSVLTSSSDQIYADENATVDEQDSADQASQDQGDEEHVDDETVPTVLIDRQQSVSPAKEDAGMPEDCEQHESIEREPDLNDVEAIDFNVTPIRPNLVLPRFVNTVVSKVPLRPEGDIPAESPIKLSKKRARSLSSAGSLVNKRRSLGNNIDVLATAPGLLETPKGKMEVFSSPHRHIRSAAPSPAQSLFSTVTTPGQTSFAIDDFGDSTLDGIELPSDELMSDDVEQEEDNLVNNKTVPDDTLITIGSTFFKTPAGASKRRSVLPSSAKSNESSTPHYAMSTKSSKSRTDATPTQTPSRARASSLKTPSAAAKPKTPSTLVASKTPAKTPLPSRTPLKPVEDGILSGAIVHVDAHTSEGADASGIFVDLLTSMGARCVKEWKWNPRASQAAGPNKASTEAPIGITHVVYKDGGKRTLEKVRDAKGQVLCVRVGWVLDCEREGKWLDEADYAVDTGILPRGGSRRRKSMEPRMLMNANGSLSAKKNVRRSVSDEYARWTPEMKFDLINTPVRGRSEMETGTPQSDSGLADDTEISSTYDSPTAATIGAGGETADIGALMSSHRKRTSNVSFHGEDEDEETSLLTSPGLATHEAQTSTPQPTVSLDVDYDPRTAATPLTPYLMAKGRDLIQMSAPPKQFNQGLFEKRAASSKLSNDADEPESESQTPEAHRGEMKKFQVKMNHAKGNGNARDGRRRTMGAALGFKPVVASPLRRE